MIEELIGLSTAPRTIGPISLRSKPSPDEAPDRARRRRSSSAGLTLMAGAADRSWLGQPVEQGQRFDQGAPLGFGVAVLERPGQPLLARLPAVVDELPAGVAERDQLPPAVARVGAA